MVKSKQKFSYLPDGTLDTTSWLIEISQRYPLQNTAMLAHACEIVKKLAQGVTTFYGRPCLEQGLDIAEIVLDLKLDQETAVAGLISGIVAIAHPSDDLIRNEFGENVSKLIVSIRQADAITQLQKSGNQPQLDKIRKMLLAMATDIRVVIIKLAERLCFMRGIKSIAPQERQRFAKEVQEIYAPLANRLGIGQIKWELEDLAFRYLEPDTYKQIAEYIAERRIDREARIEALIRTLEQNLIAKHIKAEVTGRAKHIYSIYAKMKNKALEHKAIFDYSAVRILVPAIEDCYKVLSIVNSLWPPIQDEFDDYIANPKPNNYRSIHTAVMGDDGKHFEIQIRTFEMHEESERGVAAHWLYKESKASPINDNNKIAFLRQLIDWHQEIAKTNPAPTHPELLEQEIFVITPAGDIIDLPMGSTPIDFAYHVHSEIGHRCRGAKVNGHIVPLTYHLQTGDKVEIMTAPEGKPSRDWLNPELGYIKSARSRSKIAYWFRQHEMPSETSQTKQPTIAKKIPPKPKKAAAPAAVTNASNLLIRMGKCCKPQPGDEIVGYITKTKGISVHTRQCKNRANLINVERFINIEWKLMSKKG